MKVILKTRYSKLDKRQKYSLTSDGCGEHWEKWLWYGIGKYLKRKINLFPFEPCGKEKLRTLGKWSGPSAIEVSKCVVKAINNWEIKKRT